MAQLGLGLAALGRPEYLTTGHAAAVAGRFDPVELERHCHAVLDAAWRGGVRHVDAARSYGAAERFLGSWLAQHPGRRDELVIGSKWGYAYVADFRPGADVHEVKEHSVARLAEQWPQTRHDLGGLPDHYLVHSVTPDSPALSDVFTSVQSTWNVLEPSVGPALAEAHDAGWFVVVKEAMANGRLATGIGRDALALAVVLAQPWADVVLSGAATVTQLQQNLAALTVGTATADAVLDELAGVAEPAESYWRSRSELAWT